MALMRGTLANDRRVGTRRDDVIDGLDGSDLLNGGGGADLLRGGAGADRLYGEGGDDRLQGGEGDDLLDGGSGRDVASFVDAAGPVVVDLRAGVALGQGSDRLVGIEDVEGGDHGDRLTGNGRANRISGGAGDDRLFGAGGDDLLDGGDGDDLFFGGAGVDRIEGGAGRDTVGYVDASVGIAVSAGTDGALTAGGRGGPVDTLRGVEVVEGSRHGDVMTGHASRAAADGGPVDQTFRGLGGDDHLVGGTGDDTLEGGEGGDMLHGDGGDEAGDDRLFGGDGDDRLVLDPGGRDLHEGGAGADVFDFCLDAWQDLAGADVIADFAAGQDRLEVRLERDGDDLLTGSDLLALLDRSGDGIIDGADAGEAGGWSVSVGDVTLGNTTAASLMIEAGPGSGVSSGGYALCLFGVAELAGADLV